MSNDKCFEGKVYTGGDQTTFPRSQCQLSLAACFLAPSGHILSNGAPSLSAFHTVGSYQHQDGGWDHFRLGAGAFCHEEPLFSVGHSESMASGLVGQAQPRALLGQLPWQLGISLSRHCPLGPLLTMTLGSADLTQRDLGYSFKASSRVPLNWPQMQKVSGALAA